MTAQFFECLGGEKSLPSLAASFQAVGGVIVRDALPADASLWEAACEIGEQCVTDAEFQKRYTHDRVAGIGYTPPGVEGKLYMSPNFLRHFFDFRPGMPAELKALAHLHAVLNDIAFSLLQSLDRAWGTQIANLTTGGPHLLRTAKYLNVECDPLQVLFPEHVDFSLLTLFVGGDGGGLEVRVGDTWHPMNLGRRDILVAAGTLMHLYRPRVKALRHRVMGSSTERLSLFFFVDPRPDVRLPNGETGAEFRTRLTLGIRND